MNGDYDGHGDNAEDDVDELDGDDHDDEDDEDEDDEGDEGDSLIPKPKGSVNRANSGGYNLQEATGYSEDRFGKIRVSQLRSSLASN